ncbi:MAG: GDP-mannose 4,6-dehydratase [Acidobacteriota bacterium]|nr:GDP-mannose 4,6-dehydratase [Acidobacteriota bacterium]
MLKALIIGCSGQDGTYLSRLLVEKGYEVLGVARERRVFPSGGVGEAIDIRRRRDVYSVLLGFQPDEIYFLAALHHSSEDPPLNDHELIERSLEVNALALNNVLAGICEECPRSRLFYAASSRIFGDPPVTPQNEATAINPLCAYGISKAAGLQLCRFYRARRAVFASVGIFYNHESPLRPNQFISKKIAGAAARIGGGSKEKLIVGDLDALVDWGYAPDYVLAAWQTLQLDEPGDFVIGSGEVHSVREFAHAAFAPLGLDWTQHVVEDGAVLTRTSSPAILCADSAKLRGLTGWRPGLSFEAMVKRMVEAEVANAA